MAKHTLKILRCSHLRFLKYVWPFYNIMHERVKPIEQQHSHWQRQRTHFIGQEVFSSCRILVEILRNEED